MADSFDFIIVGGGTAGSVLAYRLGELDDVRILILEAGGSDTGDAVETPWRWN